MKSMLRSGLLTALVLIGMHGGNALNMNNLYHNNNNEESGILPNGDANYEFVKLGTPIHFYSETYDHIYVNTNGILTFGAEFPHFVNLPFPLEYPAIAPFYSNVDTTDANHTSSISYFKSFDPEILSRASNFVKIAFADAYDFQAASVFVVTWANVGHYQAKNDVGNTFQVAVISNDEETYVQYLYPQGGLNWVKGDIGESGLPDVRAQAGFVSEDGRYFSLKGSATDKASYLSDLTNCGEPGSWLFRTGPLGVENNVEEPDYGAGSIEDETVSSCERNGKLKCHSKATCVDTRKGFCCKCHSGYYGNGYSCLKEDIPIRVSGKVSGSLNNIPIASQLQSYVVMADGRSYTAVSPLIPDVGYSMQLLQVLGGTIGWLFAKPSSDAKNGYQITGGRFNHTTTIRFEGTGESCVIVQKFEGLNAWDQLSIVIEITGTLPDIPQNAPIQINDITEEFSYNTENSVRSIGSRRISVDNREFVLHVDQEIDFEKCDMAEDENYASLGAFYNKISKITSSYQSRENALRMGMLNKMVTNLDSNPCTDVQCGDNSICVPNDDDGYECNCKNGYTFTPYAQSNSGIQNCVDIDECSSENICDENADCINDPGGYSCRCRNGYSGNGYTCEISASHLQHHPSENTTPPDSTLTTPEHYQCDQCSDRATCSNGVCVCQDGWSGDGVECTYNCPNEYIWSVDRCIPPNSDEDEAEVAPFCEQNGCSCPTGYELIEFAVGQTCRLLPVDENARVSEEEDRLPCDIENNCSPYAQCEWVESELRNKCVCNPQYEGNGYQCTEVEVSCIYENICHEHASCSYDERVGKSICKCEAGFEGDGKYCQPAPECRDHETCGINAMCDYGVCVCQQGFDRDISNFCVPSSCGGAICAENAECKVDPLEQISYCSCPPDFEGDGIYSCKPIPPPCNVRNNCGLYAHCAPNYRNPSLYECVCNVGYQGDGFVCELEVNCLNNPSLCSENAQCTSTAAGLQCVCHTGFIGNGSVCTTPPRLESGFLLMSQGVTTVRIPFDGKRGQPVSMSNMAIGLDKDCLQGRVYWSDISNKQIVSVKYDGTDRQVFISEDILSPEGIAIDWISRRLYWTDSTKDTVEVASLDDPKLRTIIVRKNLVNPRGIAVDPHQNKLYWSDWNRDGPKIEWSNLDGTEREILLSDPAVKLPNSLSISQSTGELCFADAGTKKVECIDTYSRAVRTIAANLSYPFGLTVTDEQFYWTDWTTKKIESVDHHGNRLTPISSPLFGNHKMYGLTAVVEKCPLFYSPCIVNNGDCLNDRICLVNTRSPSGRACKCVDAAVTCNEIQNDY